MDSLVCHLCGDWFLVCLAAEVTFTKSADHIQWTATAKKFWRYLW